MKPLICLLWILAFCTFQAHASTVVALIQPGSSKPNAGDTLVYRTETNERLIIDTAVILNASNYASHPWLGDLFRSGGFPFASPVGPSRTLRFYPLADCSYNKTSLATFSYVPLHFVAITSVCKGDTVPNSYGCAVVIVLTDLHTLKAVAAVDVEERWFNSEYEDDGLAIPLVIPSDATETLSLIATPDLNRDGKVTSPDLLMFQSAWHTDTVPAVKPK